MSRDRTINRRLNDELRVHLLGGAVIASSKIASLDLAKLRKLVGRLARYRDFSRALDPTGEHAFGVFDFEGATIVFQITTEPTTRLPSAPTELVPAERILTIMLAEEYAARAS